MKKTIGEILLIVGILGILTLLGIAMYHAGGWMGVTGLFSVIFFIGGIAILDD